MNELFEKLATMTDEEILHDIKEAFDLEYPDNRDEAYERAREHIQEGIDETTKQLEGLNRLAALFLRYREEVLKK